MDMPATQKLRKWHFLMLGATLILLSAYLWYWNWRALGIPKPLQPEHLMTITSFVVGLFVMCVFIYRLSRRQLTIMLIGEVIVNLLASLATLWIFRTYPKIFDWLCPMELADASAAYLADWRQYFLTPALYAIHIGLLLLFIMSLVMFLVRKPTDQPE
jgi:hypothetical protein